MKSNLLMNLLRALLVTLPATMARQHPLNTGRKSGKVYNVPHGGGAREVARRARQIQYGVRDSSLSQRLDRADRLMDYMSASVFYLDDVPGLLPLPASSYAVGTFRTRHRNVASTRYGSGKVAQ